MTELVTECRRESPFDPLFDIGPAGHARLNPGWTGAVSDFCEAMRTEVGANPTVRCWPYRIGNVGFIAFDVSGEGGDVSLPIAEGDCIEIPLQGKVLESTDPLCLVADTVDAFYLVSTLLEALGLPAASGGVAVFGGRTIAR